MNQAVASNQFLQLVAQYMYGVLNSGHFFRLFVNDVFPTPDFTYRDFAEATFDGYEPFNLAGQFQRPFETFSGQYQMDATAGPFVCEGGSQTVFGAFITDLASLKISRRFDAPLLVSSGAFFNLPVSVLCDAISILVV